MRSFQFFLIALIIIAILIAIFWNRLPLRLITPYLNNRPIAITGTVQKISYADSRTAYVYLPNSYNDTSNKLPVLYHLHGAFMRKSWVEKECNFLGSKLDEAVDAGKIDPMILVCLVDPEGDSMWSDSYDGKYPVSSAFIKELIPHIDDAYRTNGQRILQGFSMGGFGTLTNGFRHPDLFAGLLVWDGALHNWQTLSSNRASIAKKMFASEAYFDDWNPWKLVAQDVDIPIWMTVGTMGATRDFGDRFRPHLETVGREIVYFDSDCPHSMFCFMDALGDEGFAFMRGVLSAD